MIQRGPRYSKEEFSRRGQEIFERKIKALVQNEEPGKFVAIDIETEDFEIDSDSLAATKRLIEKHDDAQIWMRRVGFPYTFRLGTPRRIGKVQIKRTER